MYFSNDNSKESWDYDDAKKVEGVYERIKELFENPDYDFNQGKHETMEVVLTEKDGYISAIKRDRTYYSLQIKYDIQLLKAVTKKFNETPLCFAFRDQSFSGKDEFHFTMKFTKNHEKELTTYGSDLEI